MNSFIQQLGERHIWRAAIAYPVAGFVFLEAAEFFVDNYQLNAKLLTVAVIIFAGGLPIALVWNWCHGQPGPQPVTKKERWSYSLLSGLTLIAATWYWVLAPGPSSGGPTDPGPSADRSIAVLPFENADGDAELDFLCEGIAESLINTLSAIPELRVISRLSALGQPLGSTARKGRTRQPTDTTCRADSWPTALRQTRSTWGSRTFARQRA